MKEVWKDIPDYEGLYQASNLGNIKSLQRTMPNSGAYGKYFTVKEKILKPHLHNNGYCSVKLSKYGKINRVTVHKLIATLFVANPHNYSIINHKDENKSNNKADNLEWCTAKYNCNYGTRNERLRIINTLVGGKKVLQYSLDGDFVKEYSSISEASRKTGVYVRSISSVCNGRGKTAGGYIWKFNK